MERADLAVGLRLVPSTPPPRPQLVTPVLRALSFDRNANRLLPGSGVNPSIFPQQQQQQFIQNPNFAPQQIPQPFVAEKKPIINQQRPSNDADGLFKDLPGGDAAAGKDNGADAVVGTEGGSDKDLGLVPQQRPSSTSAASIGPAALTGNAAAFLPQLQLQRLGIVLEFLK